jgi:hypothetical protein
MYHTEIKRAENHPVTGKAQYKVTRCFFTEHFIYFHVEATRPVPVCLVPKGAILHTKKPYRVGNLINPRKALGI